MQSVEDDKGRDIKWLGQVSTAGHWQMCEEGADNERIIHGPSQQTSFEASYAWHCLYS